MFSIIMPTYNAGMFIEKAIHSVLKQKYRDFELIVVDDGSTDNTREVVIGNNDKRIKYIYQNNGGVSAARNIGIKNSIGNYVCFLDADDEWKENHLSVLSELIDKYSNSCFFVTGYDIRLKNGEILHKSQVVLKKINEATFECEDGIRMITQYGYFFNTNTVCCHRSVFNKVGFFEVGVKNSEDDDMWMRIMVYYSIVVSKEVTTIYHRENSIATSKLLTNISVFSKRVDEYMALDGITEEKKESLRVWKERSKLSYCRKLIINGAKKEARRIFRQINVKKVSRKKYYSTLLSFIVPAKVVRRYIDSRDKEYYA